MRSIQSKTAQARLHRFLEKGGTVQQWLDLPEDELEKLFEKGMRLFNENHFESARRTFALLTLLTPNHPKYWRFLGCAQIKEKNWEGAIATLEMYATLVNDDRQAKEWISNCQKWAKRKKRI